MRLDFDGDDRVRLATPPDAVRKVLLDPVELLAMFGDLLDASSRPDRWVGPGLHAGPATIAVALDVAVESPAADRVHVRGRPVEGATPTTLDVDLRLRPGDVGGTTRVDATWRLCLQVTGPQLLARTLHPVVARSSRHTTGEIRARLRDRFGPA